MIKLTTASLAPFKGWADTANVRSQILCQVPDIPNDNATRKTSFLSRLALSVCKNRNKPAFTDVKKRRQQYTGKFSARERFEICGYTMLFTPRRGGGYGYRLHVVVCWLVPECSERKPQIKQEPVVKY